MDIYDLLADPAIIPARLPATWVFPAMDRAVHLKPTWGFSVAMNSSRTFNFEAINGENPQGWHTSDGMTYLYNSDLAHFSDSFWPTVDPQRLPGITVARGSMPLQSQFGGSNVAGGTTLGNAGTALLRLLSPDKQGDAKKSWFFFDDEVVALGSDIKSSGGQPVETIVENRRMLPGFTFDVDPAGVWAYLGALCPIGRSGTTFRMGPGGTRWKRAGTGAGPTSMSWPPPI